MTYLMLPSSAASDPALRHELALRNETCESYYNLAAQKRLVDDAYRAGLDAYARETKSRSKTTTVTVHGREVPCSTEGFYVTCP